MYLLCNRNAILSEYWSIQALAGGYSKSVDNSMCTFYCDNWKTIARGLSRTYIYQRTCMFKLWLLTLIYLFLLIFPWFELIWETGNTQRYARMLLITYSSNMHMQYFKLVCRQNIWWKNMLGFNPFFWPVKTRLPFCLDVVTCFVQQF